MPEKETMTISKDDVGVLTIKENKSYAGRLTCSGQLTYSVKTREEFDPILDDIGKGKNIGKYKRTIEKHFAGQLPYRLSEVSERLEALNNPEFKTVVFRLKFTRDGCNNDNTKLVKDLIAKGVAGNFVIVCPACGNKTDVGVPGKKPPQEKKVLDKDWAK